MATEVTVARESGVRALNALSTSSKDVGAREERKRRRDYKREYKELKKSDDRMPVTKEKESHPNLATGSLSRPNDAKKHLLYQTRTVAELKAAEYVWRHPEALRHVRSSWLGESKDLTDAAERAKIASKAKRGVVDYQVYSLRYKKRNFVVKTENIGNDYERLYHLHMKTK